MSSLRKVLVIGSGGREHALALRLLESASVREVIVAPGNAGTESAPPDLSHKVLRNLAAEPVSAAVSERPDLIVIGPEAPLCAGLVDDLEAAGALVFGPRRAAAELEGSKAFMKDFAVRHKIPTARHVVVRRLEELPHALASFEAAPVVKADGLCAGKGVVVALTHEEARRAAEAMLKGESFGDAGRIVVLEERIVGSEASVHVISDGERGVVLPAVQDHKRIGDGDTGPNTGGMGTYGPAPLVSPALARVIETTILQPTIRGMSAEGRPFRGVLFAGIMVRPDGTPLLLEFNVRFGDPETQVLMNVLDGDLADALAGAAAGSLEPTSLRTSTRHAVCVVLAAPGYPEAPRAGDVIQGLDAANALAGVRVYHAGTRVQLGRVVSAGGRVLGITARGSSLAEAHSRAYTAVGSISFSGMQWRRDIATQALGGGSAAADSRSLDATQRRS